MTFVRPQLGEMLCRILGVDPSEVLSITLVCAADAHPVAHITRMIGPGEEEQIFRAVQAADKPIIKEMV